MALGPGPSPGSPGPPRRPAAARARRIASANRLVKGDGFAATDAATDITAALAS